MLVEIVGSDGGAREWVLFEFQGTIEGRDGSALNGMPLGPIECVGKVIKPFPYLPAALDVYVHQSYLHEYDALLLHGEWVALWARGV